jgi:hypothetical protein
VVLEVKFEERTARKIQARNGIFLVVYVIEKKGAAEKDT